MSEPTGGNPAGQPPQETPQPDPSSSETSQPLEGSTSSDPLVQETSSSEPAVETTTDQPPAETTTSAPLPEETTTEPDPEPTPTEQETTSEVVETTTSVEEETTTSAPEETTEPSRTTITLETSSDGSVQTSVIVITSTRTQDREQTTADPTSTGAEPGTIDPSGGSSDGGLDKGAKVAIGVVVPIVAIALIAIAVLFWWKKRRARQEAEEERRKEVEDYSYNPNADPTIPAVGMQDNYEMREDGSSGYRGWGSTTLAGSTGRKASTTMSGGVAGAAYSDVTTSPGRGGGSEARSGEPLMEGEILGAMGPSAANNRNGDVRRGPSNASSSYSAANRSENSDGMGMAYSDGGYDQYAQNNPYVDNGYGGRTQELPGQPIIRDNPARRNTRIENPSHYPQQSAGISQNF